MDEALLLNQAIIEIKAGHKIEAKQLLKHVLEANPQNEQAWLWISAVVDTDAERVMCLKQVLRINPNNTVAQKGITHTQTHTDRGSFPETTPAAPPYSSEPLALPGKQQLNKGDGQESIQEEVEIQEHELHSNLIIGSLQILSWLFFDPQAWCAHIAYLDADLKPDFTLIELHKQHWHNPLLRRLLIQGYFILPALAELLMCIVLYIAGESPIDHLLINGIGIGMTLGILLGINVSVASGIIGCIFFIVFAASHLDQKLPIYSVIFAVILGAIGYVSSIFSNQNSKVPLPKQVIGFIVGTLSSIITLFITGIIGIVVTLVILLIHQISLGILTSSIEIRRIIGSVYYYITEQEKYKLIYLTFASIITYIIMSITIRLRRDIQHTKNINYKILFGLLICIASNIILVPALDFVYSISDIDKLQGLISIALSAVSNGALIAIAFILPYITTRLLASPWVGALAGTTVSWYLLEVFLKREERDITWNTLLFSFMSMLLCLTFNLWRPILHRIVLNIQEFVIYRWRDDSE